MIRILLLDDHAVVRTGYRRLIDSEPDMQVVAEAATSSQACELIRNHTTDVAVVDLSLKNDSGLEAIRRLRERCPQIRILVFTMHAHQGYALQALRAGASGYLTKDSDPQDMIEALRMIAKGRRLFSADVTQAFLADPQMATTDPISQLTPREFEVLRMASSGRSIDEIAQALHLSKKTIFNYMSLIRQKLDVRSDFKLLHMAVENGIAHL